MRTSLPSALIPALAASLVLVAPAPAQKRYENERYGFEILIPKDFEETPINLDEKYVVAKFLYKREVEAKKEWDSMTPEIRVIVFPKVDLKEIARQRAKERLSEEEKKTLYFDFENPYKNYTEYLRENYSKGSLTGWHVAKEDKTKVGGLDAVYKEIAVKSQFDENPTRIIFVWEVDMGDATYVVHCESLKDYESKFKGFVRSAIGRFRKTDSYGNLGGATTGERAAGQPGGKNRVERGLNKTFAELENMTPEERRDYRTKLLEATKEKAVETMPDGWKVYEAEPFTVIYDTDIRFAKMVGKQAQLMWKLMNEEFGYVGSDYAVPCLVRVCKSNAEANAYIDTSAKSSFNYARQEIVTYEDRDWLWNDDASFYFNQAIIQQFFYHKNPRIWWALPPWLDDGLVLYLSYLRMRGSKMEPKPDEWSMEIIRDGLRKDEFKPTSELISARWGNYASAGRQARIQAMAMVQFLETKGQRSKKYKNVIADYIGLLDKKLRELEKAREEDLQSTISESGKDDDVGERLRNWSREWRKKSDQIFDECQKAVFGAWDESDWKRFDDDWKKAFK